MIKADDLAKAVNSQLEVYQDEVNAKIKDIVPLVANDTVKQLKSTSPKRTGKYAKEWSVKKESTRLSSTATVYNKRRYRLTHLLEKGHAKRGGGRVAPVPHIADAEQKAVDEIVKRLKEKL